MAVARTSVGELCHLQVRFEAVVEAPFEDSCITTVLRSYLGVWVAGIEH